MYLSSRGERYRYATNRCLRRVSMGHVVQNERDEGKSKLTGEIGNANEQLQWSVIDSKGLLLLFVG